MLTTENCMIPTQSCKMYVGKAYFYISLIYPRTTWFIKRVCWTLFIPVCQFFIGPKYTWGPIYGSKCLTLTNTPCWNLTDVTLADEDTNSILTDIVNIRAIQVNVTMHIDATWWPTLELMQVAPPDDQILNGAIMFNWCRWHHLVAKIATDASCAIW